MNKETQESEAMGSEAAMLRAELEAAQAELCEFYQWASERKGYKLECIQLRAEVEKLRERVAELSLKPRLKLESRKSLSRRYTMEQINLTSKALHE